MASTEQTGAAAAAGGKLVPEPIDSGMENDIAQFVRLDTEMKRAKKQMSEVRKTVNLHRQNIIQYMIRTKTDKLVGINGGTQYLECVQKTLKRRPTSEQMLTKLAELVRSGVNDPVAMLEAIQNCGGTYSEHRLSRRTRRVNAASMVAAVVAAGKKKLRKPAAKKRKLTVTESAPSKQ